MEVPGSSGELLIAPVIIVVSGLGTPAAQGRPTYSAMTSRLAQMAAKICYLFPLCPRQLVALKEEIPCVLKSKTESSR